MAELKAFIQRHFDKLFLAAVLGLGGFLQFSFISKSSIWHDEGYSLLLAPQSLGEILVRTARDVHPPLYYLLLHFWTNMFGLSEVAVRSLSVVCILGLIIVMFLLVKRLFGPKPARLSAVFMALGPFLIRYGQEARMYALVAFLLALATHLLITALTSGSKKRLYLYALVMAAAFYTHYYAVFMVPVHWIYVMSRTLWGNKRTPRRLDLRSLHWWLANYAVIGLFSFWLPTAYRQFTRVQGGFWIPPVNLKTLPATMWQWLHFSSFETIPLVLGLLIPIVFLGILIAATFLNKLQRKSLVLLGLWTVFGPLAIFFVSLLARPVFIDRYFVFAASALYPLLAVLLYLRPLNYLYRLRPIFIVGLVVLFGFGIRNVYDSSNHQMRQVGQYVSQNFQAGDDIIAGELYVYLDFSYYNHTGQELKLYAPKGINGYGETSLLYDKPELIINDYKQLSPQSGQVWIVAKPGQKDYVQEVPSEWQLTDKVISNTSAAYRYKIPPAAEPPKVCAQVITTAKNPQTGEVKTFPNACLPPGWQPL